MVRILLPVSLPSRCLAFACLLSVLGGTRIQAADEPDSRFLRFEYGATITGLPRGARVRVWLPVAQSNEDQDVIQLQSSLPARGRVSIEPVYGNKMLYFDTTGPAAGSLAFKQTYEVRRREVRGLAGPGQKSKLTSNQRRLFLSANRHVPLRGRQLSLLDGLTLPLDSLERARKLYYLVDDHVRYDKSRPGYGNGDVQWVCDSRFGNCTDFHSLFISLSRSVGLPARFEIGFPLPPQRGEGTIGGYHCWALFHHPAQGWVPVDISEADKNPDLKQYYFGNLTENRITFTIGRDLNLVPRQKGPPLNYFIYPYVEVNGEPWPADRLQKQFKFRDLEGT